MAVTPLKTQLLKQISTLPSPLHFICCCQRFKSHDLISKTVKMWTSKQPAQLETLQAGETHHPHSSAANQGSVLSHVSL